MRSMIPQRFHVVVPRRNLAGSRNVRVPTGIGVSAGGVHRQYGRIKIRLLVNGTVVNRVQHRPVRFSEYRKSESLITTHTRPSGFRRNLTTARETKHTDITRRMSYYLV